MTAKRPPKQEQYKVQASPTQEHTLLFAEPPGLFSK